MIVEELSERVGGEEARFEAAERGGIGRVDARESVGVEGTELLLYEVGQEPSAVLLETHFNPFLDSFLLPLFLPPTKHPLLWCTTMGMTGGR